MTQSDGKIVELFDEFGTDMPDGRLTEPSSDKVYRLREAIVMSKKLGRPLTDEEMECFEVCNVVAEDNNYKVNS